MARTGESVCALERGAERWPGEYPASFKAVVKQLSIGGVRSNGRHLAQMLSGDNSAGMFHVMAGSGLSAFVCHGELLSSSRPRMNNIQKPLTDVQKALEEQA